MLSPDVIEFLNRGGDTGRSDWVEKNPVLGNLVTRQVINIRPTAIPDAKRIVAFENATGRHVQIHYRDGSHCHMLQVNECSTVDAIMELIGQVEQIGGTCHVVRTFLILYIPADYYLSITEPFCNGFLLKKNEGGKRLKE